MKMSDMKTITFSDGYKIEITDTGMVIRTAPGAKPLRVHATHFREVPETGDVADFLRKRGKLLCDYLFAEPSPGSRSFIRAGLGVRESITEISARARSEQAECASKKRAKGLAVEVREEREVQL